MSGNRLEELKLEIVRLEQKLATAESLSERQELLSQILKILHEIREILYKPHNNP